MACSVQEGENIFLTKDDHLTEQNEASTLRRKRSTSTSLLTDEDVSKKHNSSEELDKATHDDSSANRKELMTKIRNQVEYYFSDENLKKDFFFQKKILENEEKWLELRWILNCRKIAALDATSDDIISSLKDSSLEVKIDETGNAWIRRTTQLPTLKMDSRFRFNKKMKHYTKNSKGYPSRVEDIHSYGCFLKVSGIPPEAGFPMIKKKFQDSIPDKKISVYVTNVTSDGVAYIYSSPFTDDINFFSQLHTLNLNGKEATIELLNDLDCVKHILDNRLPRSLVSDRLKTMMKSQSTPICLGEKTFESIDHLRKCCQELLSITPAGESLKPGAFQVIRSLLEYHPNATQKLSNVDFIKADIRTDLPLQPHEQPPKCFFVVRKDGSTEDFSIRRCIEQLARTRAGE